MARRRIAVVTCLALAWAVGAVAAMPGLDGFEGTWVRDVRERDDAAREAVIERVTEPMSLAFRGFARRVMRKRMVPVEQYVIGQGADAPQIHNDKGVVFLLDGRTHVTGEHREVASRLSEGEIEQSWTEGTDSHGTTTWRLEGEGCLIVWQRVIDSHFEAPIEFSTRYRRAP